MRPLARARTRSRADHRPRADPKRSRNRAWPGV